MDRRFIKHYSDQALRFDLKEGAKAMKPVSEVLGEGYPEVDIDIDFLRHQFANDISDAMVERIKGADILFVEDRGWTKSSLGDLNKVSEGVLSPKKTPSFIVGEEGEDSFSYKYCETIYNTHKPILTADIPEGHALDEKFQEERQELLDRSKEIKPTIFKEMLKLRDEYDALLAKQDSVRNEYFKQYFAHALKTFLDEHSEYKQKAHLNIHANYGEMHFPIVHNVKQFGEVSVHFSSRYRSVVYKTSFRKAYGYPVTDVSRAQSWLTDMLYDLNSYESKGKNDETSVNEIERMAYSFSFEEIEQVYNELQEAISDTARLDILGRIRAMARERVKDNSIVRE